MVCWASEEDVRSLKEGAWERSLLCLTLKLRPVRESSVTSVGPFGGGSIESAKQGRVLGFS